MTGRIDTVIFDMDGVIFDSEILVLQCWREVAERHGMLMRRVMSVWGRTVWSVRGYF